MAEGITQTCDDWHFFDCYFKNIRAGGIWAYGMSRRLLVEWCVFEDIATSIGSPKPASQDAMYIQGRDTIFRFNVNRHCKGGLWMLW